MRRELSTSPHAPDYDLRSRDLESLQEELVEKILATRRAETICTVWLPGTSPYANVVRTVEQKVFPQIPALMRSVERECLFLGLVDVRAENRRLVHAFRLCGRVLGAPTIIDLTDNGFGIALLDDLVRSGQITGAEIRQYYDSRAVDLGKCLSVETNFRVGDRVEWGGLRVSDLGYIAVFQVLDRLGIKDDAAIFAHLNPPAIASLGHVGVQYSAIAGRDDLRTPTIDEDGNQSVDASYTPVEIPLSVENLNVFDGLYAFAVPVVEITHGDTIDLRDPKGPDVIDLTDGAESARLSESGVESE